MSDDSKVRRWKSLIEPSVVAVVGASETKPNMGRRLVEAAGRGASGCRVTPIHPRANFIANFACLPSLTEACAEAVPDVLFVATPQDAVSGLLREAVDAGVPGVVVLTTILGDDFDSMVNSALGGERFDPDRHPWIIGPGSNGLVSGTLGVSLTSNPSVEQVPRAPGGVTIISQSGAMGLSTIWALARDSGVPVSSVWTLGSQRMIKWWEVAEAALLSRDPAAVCVIAEEVCSFKDLARLGRLSEECRIPFGLLHVGRSPRGSSVTSSHTGALGTSTRLLRSACFRTGAEPLGTLRDLVEFALQAASRDRSRIVRTTAGVAGKGAPRAAVASPSGGALAYAMDRLDRVVLDLPSTPVNVRQDLLQLLDTSASVENPFDLGARAATDGSVAAEALERLIDGCDLDVLVVCYAADIGFLEVVQRLVPCAERNGVTLDFVCLTENPIILAKARTLTAESSLVTVWSDLELLVAAMAVRAERRDSPLSEGMEVVINPERVAEIVLALGQFEAPILSETESEVVLRGSAICRPEGVLLSPRGGFDDQATAAWFQNHAGPYAVKGLVDGISHKQHAGLVALGVPDEATVRETVGHFAAGPHGTNLQGILVQEMVRHVGIELMVSVRIDGSLGPHCLVASGGTEVEKHEDFAIIFPPFTIDAVRSAIERIAAGETSLGGDLDRHSENIAQFAATSAAVIAAIGRDLTVELNPVVVDSSTGNLVALDALVTCG